MNTDRFDQLRKQVLRDIFTKKNIVDTWRQVVREQLRGMDFKDLYDYYDFHYNIEDRALSLRTEITSGGYRASTPLVYRAEKKFGVCRHMVIPNPVDALAMQVLVDCVADGILSQQPSQNAFYARSKHYIPIPHQAAEYGLNIRRQWIKLQKEIYRFNEEKELLVVTDLANYYDSISIEELRKAFLGLVVRQDSEVIVDILFRIIEDISWKPDYLPYRRHGLPTSNLEAIRLLAHSFVFEVDSVLDIRSDGCFTRWMDDIVFGADSKREAIGTISSISDMLKSRGLALNLAKTAIYSTSEAFYHFQIEENKYLDGYGVVSVDDSEHDEKIGHLLTKFLEHLDHRDARYWGKVTKRYITAFGRSRSDKILQYVVSLYIDNPSLRPNLHIYLASLGFNEKTGGVILEILAGIDLFDDISLVQISHLIAQWEIHVSAESNRFLDDVRNHLQSFSFSTKNPADFYSVLWFRAKYDHEEDLLRFVMRYQNLWQSNPFLRRQVTSVFSRLLVMRRRDIDEIISMQIASGIASVVSVAAQLRDFASISLIDKRLSLYLFNINKPQRPYPLAKFLVLCSVLNSEPIRRNSGVRKSVLEHIYDPYYLKWLDHQYNIR
jgi:hypothetical protein